MRRVTVHGKQPCRAGRVWRNVGMRGWRQQVGHRAPKKTSLKNRAAETLPEVLVSSYGSLLNASSPLAKRQVKLVRKLNSSARRSNAATYATQPVRVIAGGEYAN